MIQIADLYDIFSEYPVVTTDSRQITSGCLFFALRGPRFDGNQYAKQALEAGASYAIVDSPEVVSDERMLLVEDVLKTLQDLAREHRRQMGIPVIGITGTNGKTTTKELMASVLQCSYNLLYTEGNLNNHIGVPLTLLRLTPEHQLALIEMGASKPGDIAELCAIAEPNYGVITNIGQAHLEGFGSLEGVKQTKGELYQWLREHDGKIMINVDDVVLESIAGGIPAVPYGQGEEAVVLGRLLPATSGNLFLSLEWGADEIGIAPVKQETQLVGSYNINNVLAAVAMGLFLDVPAENIRQAIASYSPSNSRSQLIKTPRGNWLVADAYNANPSSMRYAVDNILAVESTMPRLLILGDMNELGEHSIAAHKNLYEEKLRGVRLWLCGPIWSSLALEEAEKTFATADELLSYLSVADRVEGHLILVKGSNGIGLNKILSAL